MYKATRIILVAVVSIALTILIVGNPGQTPTPAMQGETAANRALLEQDILLTKQLTLIHYSHLFKRYAKQIDDLPIQNKQIPAILAKINQEDDQLLDVQWVAEQTHPLYDTTRLPLNIRSSLLPYTRLAQEGTSQGKVYQSPVIEAGNQAYVVVAVPAVGNNGAIIGIISQDVIRQMEQNDKQNLKLIPMPHSNSWQIETVNTNDLQRKVVDEPQDEAGTSHYHIQQVVVRFTQPPSESELDQIRTDIGAVYWEKIGYTFVFESSFMYAEQLMDYFRRKNTVYVEPHYMYSTNDRTVWAKPIEKKQQAFVPNDYLYQRYQWNLPMINTTYGWSLSKGSKEVIVAVIDTGVDLNHSDLTGQLIAGINLINRNKSSQDDVGHGTHVAGIISAKVNNEEGVAGMSWFNPIMPIKALDETGAGSTYSVAQAIIWATDHGAKVINMSLGNYAPAQFLHDAIRYAFDRDVLLVAASGNDNTSKPGYPAAYPEVLAVAATDWNNRKASFSNYGDYIDVSAPGVSIASTYTNNQYAALSGTSMASPHVSALAALIRSINPSLKNTEVMDLIRNTAHDLGSPGHDPIYGYGNIDVNKALATADPNQQPMALETYSFWNKMELFFRKAVGL